MTLLWNWTWTEKGRSVLGKSPNLSQRWIPFVPGRVPLFQRHRPAQNACLLHYFLFLARALIFFSLLCWNSLHFSFARSSLFFKCFPLIALRFRGSRGKNNPCFLEVFLAFCRAAPKGTNAHLRVFCNFFLVFCEDLRFPNALFSRKRRESAKICVWARFVSLGSSLKRAPWFWKKKQVASKKGTYTFNT